MDTKHPVSVLVWNCNGISGKRHQLELVLDRHKPDLFALTETKLIGSILDKEICDNYTLYRLDRVNSSGRGGGVLIGVCDTSNILVNKITPEEKGEILSLDLSIGGFSFSFTVYYRRPAINSIDDFLTWHRNQTSCNQLIVGDFNLPDIDWSKGQLKRRLNPNMHETFLNFVEASDLEQFVDFPTHTHGNTLDLVLSNLDLSNPISEPSCSDHHVLLFDLFSEHPISHSINNNNTTPFWNFKKANIPEIMIDCYDIETKISQQVKVGAPVNTVWETFKSSILSSASKNIPSKRRKPTPSPWMSKSTEREVNRRKRWHKTSKIHNTAENREKVSKQSKLCDKLINRDYNAFINNHICSKLENGDSKPLFKFIANRRGNSNTIKKLDGCLSDSAADIADCFASAFSSVFTDDDGRQPPTNPCTAQQSSRIKIEPKGVLKQLQSLDRTKGAGPDGLSSALLKFLANFIYKPLSLIYQYSLDTGAAPDDWKLANVIPIHKKSSRSNPLNYRPISMTCIASKILEHILCHDINNFLDDNNLLVECQHGFRKKHGCDTQLLTTVTDLVEAYDQNIPVDLAVLDFSKAFDVVSHPKLLLKMKAIGIHSSTCNWISDWLSNRLLTVTVNGAQSSLHRVTSGVPQGSVLGPLLFLLYINDMPSCVHFCNLRLFADDSLAFHRIQSQVDVDHMQSDLDRLIEWANTWQMKFNVDKCEHMRIQRQTQNSTQASYTLNNSKLTQVSSIKYLGVHIDDQLSFDKHIREICKKATQTLHMLMRNLKKARTKSRSICYKCICRPILEYASQSWSPHLVKHIDTIEAINRKAFRWAYHKKKFDHISDLMTQLDWQTLAERRQNSDLKLYFKIIAGSAAVDESKVSTSHMHDHNTRTGSVVGTINTNVKKYAFRQRVYRYLNPPIHRTDL